MGFLSRLFGPPSKHAFAKRLLRRFSAANPLCDLVYDRDNFQLRPAGEVGTVVNLTNIYAEYCTADPVHRQQLMNNYVATFAVSHQELPASFDDARAGIMPSIRARSFFDLMRLSAELELDGVEPKLPVVQPINDDLVCAFVYDNGPSMRFLLQKDLDNWGTTIYDIMELAKHNFEQVPPMGFSKIGDNFYFVLGDADYGATRLVHDDFLAKMKVEGDMVAALPNRGTLMLSGTGSDEGLKVMAALLETEVEKPRPITSVLFRRVGEEWEPWLPHVNHPTYAAFKLAAVKSIGNDYHEQKQLLEKLGETRGDVAFVASFSATQNATTGEVSSYCVWSKGVCSLLPKTDAIGLVDEHQQVIGMVPWSEIAEVAGDLMVPQDMYPERFRVQRFLSEKQLAALTKRGLLKPV